MKQRTIGTIALGLACLLGLAFAYVTTRPHTLGMLARDVVILQSVLAVTAIVALVVAGILWARSAHALRPRVLLPALASGAIAFGVASAFDVPTIAITAGTTILVWCIALAVNRPTPVPSPE